MTTIAATSILSSIHALDPSKRIDTLLLRYPRCIHSEFMTHRMFSRNASSSRAIPVEKLIQDVLDDPYVPLHWGANQKGMQASEECNTQILILDERFTRTGCRPASREEAWLYARDNAVAMARAFSKAGYHKQIVNRLLEPFSHITVVVTSSNWSNFLALRDHKDAEPHIMLLAREVRKALKSAKPQILNPGEAHLPFIKDSDVLEVMSMNISGQTKFELLRKLSVACCASTSYKTVEGFDMTFDRAVALYDKLFTMKPVHASPFEHIVEADGDDAADDNDAWNNPETGGNLGEGWIQFRKTLEDECL